MRALRFWALWRVRFGRGCWTRTVRWGTVEDQREAKGRLGCVIMASGTGSRFAAALGVAGGDEPSNKLFEELGASTVLGTTIDSVPPCYDVVVSTRWPAAAMVAAQHGARFALHHGPQRSDSVRAGLGEGLGREWRGCLFLPGDQPLVSRESFERLAEAFWREPQYVYRLGWKGHPGSPVLFPALLFRFDEARGRRRRFRGLAQGGATRKDRRGREQGRASGHRCARRFGRRPRPAVRRRCIGT